MYAMKITYYHTLYKRNVTDIVAGSIEVKDGKVVFASGGHRYAVELENIVSIDPIEE